MNWYRVKEYIAGYVTYYVVPAENKASLFHKMEEAGYMNEDADYEVTDLKFKDHVAKIVEIDIW